MGIPNFISYPSSQPLLINSIEERYRSRLSSYEMPHFERKITFFKVLLRGDFAGTKSDTPDLLGIDRNWEMGLVCKRIQFVLYLSLALYC